jgi:hypothetical protein
MLFNRFGILKRISSRFSVLVLFSCIPHLLSNLLQLLFTSPKRSVGERVGIPISTQLGVACTNQCNLLSLHLGI